MDVHKFIKRFGGENSLKRLLAMSAQIESTGLLFERNQSNPDENLLVLVKYQCLTAMDAVFEYGIFEIINGEFISHPSYEVFSNMNRTYLAIDWRYASRCF